MLRICFYVALPLACMLELMIVYPVIDVPGCYSYRFCFVCDDFEWMEVGSSGDWACNCSNLVIKLLTYAMVSSPVLSLSKTLNTD